MDVREVQRLRAMEDENCRLKQLVADLSLHQEVLKAVIGKGGWNAPGSLVDAAADNFVGPQCRPKFTQKKLPNQSLWMVVNSFRRAVDLY